MCWIYFAIYFIENVSRETLYGKLGVFEM